MSVALDSDAVIRNVAGVPSDTTAFVDWILSTGVARARHLRAERREHSVVR